MTLLESILYQGEDVRLIITAARLSCEAPSVAVWKYGQG